MEIIREREEERRKVIKEARAWAKSLQLKSTVILIGSYARGDFNLWSDVDILLIAHFEGNVLQRLKNINHPPGYEILPLTPNEFYRLMKRRDPLALDALTYGVVLRDNLGITKMLRKISKPTKQENVEI